MEDLYIWAILIPIAIVFVLILAVAIKIAITYTRRIKLTNNESEVDVELQEKLITAFGGRENIISVYHEMSRLTVKVNDLTKANLEELKSLGATGILVMGNDIKCGFGDQAEKIYKLIKI